MAAEFWLRELKVLVDGELFADEALKIDLQARRILGSTPSTATLRIYNVTPEKRAAAHAWDSDTRITIQAGYKSLGNLGVVFDGFVRDVFIQYEKTDFIVEVHIADGDKAHRRGDVIANWDKGTLPSTIATDIFSIGFQPYGVGKGEWHPNLYSEPAIKRFWPAMSTAVEEMDKLLKTLETGPASNKQRGYYWFIDNGLLSIVPAYGYTGKTISVSSHDWVQGASNISDTGCSIECFLNPNFRLGWIVDVFTEELFSNDANGPYRISAININAGTWDESSPFNAVIEATKIEGASTKRV